KQKSWHYLTAVAAPPLSGTERKIGADCVLAPNSRSNPLDHLPQMKRGNHADCLYAADYAKRHQAREALFVNQGLIIEGSSSNIFALYADDLYTPPLGKLVLAGVTRRALIKAAIEYGLKIKEEALPLEKLYQADEVWLSNSMIELFPVASIDATPLNCGQRWQEIHQLYKQRTTSLTSAPIYL
ncbi:MAG: aminotransferase class IV, partial [Geopsychrobacter sp.]|nr:aminotransferase class IV [Geopsychrobacter sp.]